MSSIETQFPELGDHNSRYPEIDPETTLKGTATGFIVWLCSGKADWATGRYLSSNWDVNELLQMKDRILEEDLLVNRLRTSG